MDWGIIGASLRSRETHEALAPQDCLYTVAIRAGADAEHRVIGSILDTEVARDNPARLIARMADPSTRIVSLTVTEKGYCHTPQTGELDERHPDIVHDLANPDAPRSAPGYLVAALARRKAAGVAPFTVLSCDNLSANGHTVQRVLTQFAALTSPELGRWIEGEVACPSTMVDRIVPETTDADRAAVASALGMADAWPVIAEPFTQWVIEDRFPAGRPDFAAVGRAIRLGRRAVRAHEAAAAQCQPFGAGLSRLSRGLRDHRRHHGRRPHFAAFARQLMEEAAPTLTMPPGTDLATYCALAAAALFQSGAASPHLADRHGRIAEASAAAARNHARPARKRACRSTPTRSPSRAGCATSRQRTSKGGSIDVRDPLAKELASIAATTGPVAERLAPALLDVSAVFGELAHDPRVQSAVTNALARLYAHGARQAVQP